MVQSRLSKEEELELIQQARRGDRDAFARLVDIYTRPLVGYISVDISGDRKDAEKLAQSVWFKVLEDIQRSPEDGGYDPEKGRFYTYITNRFAKYEALKWRHQEQIQEEIDIQADPEQRPDVILLVKEKRYLEALVYSKLLRLIFLCAGYPHQQLAFGYSRLIYGNKSKGTRMIEGDSRTVDDEHGDKPLKDVADSFWKDYQSQLAIGSAEPDQFQESLTPLYTRLNLKLATLFELSPPLMNQLSHMRSQYAGSTSLRDYYTDKRGFQEAIPDWCNKVKNRIRAILDLKSTAESGEDVYELATSLHEIPPESSTCSRCKLRRVPPCAPCGNIHR